jgi:putative membrane protein
VSDQKTPSTPGQSAKATVTAARSAASAAQTTRSSAERTTQLALDRTVLAAERTYAAWVRTGLGSLASGMGAQKLLQGAMPGWLVQVTGSVLVLFSAFCFVAGIWRQIFPSDPEPEPDVRQLPTPLLAAVNAFLALVALAALAAIWKAVPA